MRLDVLVAVRLDEDMLAGAVDAEVFADAEWLLAHGVVGSIADATGGAAAVVQVGQGRRVEVWVGVVHGGLCAECDCEAGRDDLCAHAVAVTLAALRSGFTWSSGAAPPSGSVDPQVRELVEAADRLSRRRLTMLVATHATTDRRLRTRLLVEAGQLGPLTQPEADQLRRTLGAIAAEATTGRWQMPDVVTAGEAIISELEILSARPASVPALLLVEHAAGLWDGLAAHLFDDWEHYDGVPEEMGERVRRVHLHVCEQLRPDPDELAERLNRIISAAQAVSCLDSPNDYKLLHGDT
ncbi:MAG TPA: hypothetical protein VI248_20840 [Kineosporiaceae bacterium]